MARPKGSGHPEDKQRADGQWSRGDRSVSRQIKQDTARPHRPVDQRHPEVGNGSQALSAKRIWKWLNGDDE